MGRTRKTQNPLWLGGGCPHQHGTPHPLLAASHFSVCPNPVILFPGSELGLLPYCPSPDILLLGTVLLLPLFSVSSLLCLQFLISSTNMDKVAFWTWSLPRSPTEIRQQQASGAGPGDLAMVSETRCLGVVTLSSPLEVALQNDLSLLVILFFTRSPYMQGFSLWLLLLHGWGVLHFFRALWGAESLLQTCKTGLLPWKHILKPQWFLSFFSIVSSHFLLPISFWGFL